ncbi:hypothetical protein C1645_792951 [Glomus cerebriforme]|uniref:HAT C-terminal dimerisation domain-containing protein n=1 Tax=Glomus cerebriforme TaxID=658196 RepID=A0A397S6A5_9GLOM|nr:hypothetical protein C1645_792951 [Glomus cerebriforme]
MEQIDFKSNPFVWYYMTKKYLFVYAYYTASERLFSDAENLLNAKRTRISPKLFKRLIFLKRNAKYLDSIHKSYGS